MDSAGPARLRPQVPADEDPSGLLRMLASDDNIIGMSLSNDGVMIVELYETDDVPRPDNFHGLPIEYHVQPADRDHDKATWTLRELLAEDRNVSDIFPSQDGLQVMLKQADDIVRPRQLRGLPISYAVASDLEVGPFSD